MLRPIFKLLGQWEVFLDKLERLAVCYVPCHCRPSNLLQKWSL